MKPKWNKVFKLYVSVNEPDYGGSEWEISVVGDRVYNVEEIEHTNWAWDPSRPRVGDIIWDWLEDAESWIEDQDWEYRTPYMQVWGLPD